MNFITITLLIVYLVLLYQTNIKSLHMLQQNRYNRGFKYLYWIEQNKSKVFLNYNLILLLLAPLTFIKTNNIFVLILIVIILLIILINKKQKKPEKTPLVYTSRIKRMLGTFTIINILLIYLLSLLDNYYYLLTIYLYLQPLLIIILNTINQPLEKYVSLSFKKKAIKKIRNMPSLEVIGITGSYGKTSSKNILNDILNIKYNSFPTPKNFNTPFGLMISINEHLNKFTDYFIAEMGACKKGEIKELCDLVKPKYGILTKIGLAHLETFKTEETIQKTKFELIESLPSDGLGILNGDDEKQTSYILKNDVSIKTIGIDNKEVDTLATDIKISMDGSSFNVKFKDSDKKYKFQTKLLGRANIYNILAGITLGKHLEISIEELINAVKEVKPVEHRLELKKYFDIYLIDDAYNSNPEGAKMALEVLNKMPGHRVIMTPGMIELGNKDHEIHYEFGSLIAQNTDEVILVGEKKTKSIYEGLIEKGFDKEKIHIINDVMEGFELLKKLKPKDQDLYALIENDLPDSFAEKKGNN